MNVHRQAIQRIFVYGATTALLAVSLAACGHRTNVTTKSAGAQQAAAGGTTLVPVGTIFSGKLQQPISTKNSHDGDTFVLVQTSRGFHRTPAIEGSTIDGHLEGVSPAGPMRNPKLTLVFDDIRMPDGTKAPVSVTLQSFNAFEPRSHHLRTIGMMIGGAVAAHKLAHKGLLGAVGGYAVSQSLKTNIEVPVGTIVLLKFTAPVTSGAAPEASPSGS
jgi:hypothetical protein